MNVFSMVKQPFKRLIFLSVFLFFVHKACSQSSDKETVLNGPLLRPAPDFSQWVITIAYPDDGASLETNPARDSLSRRPRTITTTKTKDIIHEEIIAINGSKTEKWYANHAQYSRTSDNGPWAQSVGEDSHEYFAYTPLPPSGFRDLEWIAKTNYVAKMKYKDRNCIVFAPKNGEDLHSGNDTVLSAKLAALDQVVFLDADSHLPVELRIHGETRTYEFQNPPAAMQTLPPDLAGAIKSGEENRKRLLLPAPRPY